MTKWTHRDQQQLEELLNRKSLYMNSARAEISAVVGRMFSSGDMSDSGRSRIVEKIMEYAEPLRDALAPLDTGIRVEASEVG